MFGKKKEVQLDQIKGFKDALKAIKTYIYLQEWEKAKKSIDNTRNRETEAFHELEPKIKDDYKALQRERKIFDKNLNTILKFEKKYEIAKIKYDREIEAKRFKVRFTSIKKELKKLVNTEKNNEAINLLTHFLEANQNRSEVVTFYSKEKKKILKNIQKSQKKDKKKIQDNAELEAIKLAGITLKTKKEKAEEKKKRKEEKKNNSFLHNAFEKINFYKRVKETYARKKLLDEVKILLEEESKAKEEIATKKLENIHKWLIKELEKKNMIWYDVYGKILGSDKISGDSFWFCETKNKYFFYIWDATGHWVRAGLIVSILSKTFQEEAPKNDIINLTLEVNNTLKENLENKNFITWLFFEFDKGFKNALNVSGMGHEPLLIYRAKEKKIERIIAWGLAGGIRIIKKAEDIKPKTLSFHKDDIILTYSDGILEAKSDENKIYGIERLEEIFLQSAQANTDIKEIYQDIIEDLKLYRWGTSFSDDTTVMMFRRNEDKDIVGEESDEIQKIKAKEWLSRKEVRKLEWKSKSELEETLSEIKKDRETKNIISILKTHYLTGEFLKLKEEATRYIKEWYIHKDINFYLKKAIENEESYKIKMKNTKMQNKYNVLLELYKKKDYQTVIQECNEIIAKDGNV